MNGSEQAQRIEKSQDLHRWLTNDFRESDKPFIHENHAFELYHAHADLLEIVDSQAQKIAGQAKEIEMLRNVTNAMRFGTYPELEIRLHMEKLEEFDCLRLKK